ncbi:diguanylate cyclase, partial [Rhizobium johnstonii]
GSDQQEAGVIAERIRSRVEAASLPNPTSRVGPWVTVSIGLAILMQNGELVSAEHMQRQADAALYLAKKTGRNRVVVHSPEVDQSLQ